MECWLPERFDDLIFRIDTLYKVERGKEGSGDYIYIFEENNEIVGVILLDGDLYKEYAEGEKSYITRKKSNSICRTS